MTKQILFNYYQYFSKSGLEREARYSYRTGWNTPEDKAFRLFCICFLCWLTLFSLAINYLVFHKLKVLPGFAAYILFLPFYLFYNKIYNTDNSIIGIYERMKGGSHQTLNHERLAALEKYVRAVTGADQRNDLPDAYRNSDMLHKIYLLGELETKGYEKAILYKTDEDLEFLRLIKSEDPKEVQKKLEAQLYSK